MGSRADFYIGIDKPRWIGSIFKDGHPWNIPAEILIQTNKTMFEEMCIEFIESKKGVVSQYGHNWPWPWESSNMTDYVYLLSESLNMVVAYSMEVNQLFDPINIVQGLGLTEAKIKRSIIFPMMGVGYGPNAAKTI